MGLHKANPSEIYAGLSGGGARNAIGKDATPCSILSGCSAPASYFLMTAKQCECWVPNGDLLVTEAARTPNRDRDRGTLTLNYTLITFIARIIFITLITPIITLIN